MDNDGFGFLGSKFYACVLPDGYVENSVDCDDNNPNINPDMNELCSTEEDDNCDGFVNENTAIDTTVYYQDADEDGYGIKTTLSMLVQHLLAMLLSKEMIGTVMTMTLLHDHICLNIAMSGMMTVMD